jgi:Gp5 N-terminal OB domain
MTERSFGHNTGIFFAKVIDNKDPTENGRYKIRVYGVHDDESNVSEEHLPWAKSMMPVSSASLGGIGSSPTGLLANSVVMGMWLDKDRTIPMIMGSAHGNKADTTATSATGQRSDDPSTENDVLSLVRTTATQGGLDTTYTSGGIQQAVSTHSPTFLPSQSYAGKVEYPYGSAIKTVGGHEIFVNNTPGNEAIRITHKSGSFYELSPDGKIIERSMGSTHRAADSDVTNSGKGNQTSTLTGNKTGTVGGSATSTIGQGSTTTATNGNVTTTAQNGTQTVQSKTGTNVTATQGNVNMASGTPPSPPASFPTTLSSIVSTAMSTLSRVTGITFPGMPSSSTSTPSSSSSSTPTPPAPAAPTSPQGSSLNMTPEGMLTALASKALGIAAGNTAISMTSDGSMTMSAGPLSLSFNPTTGLTASMPGGPSLSLNPTTGPSIGVGNSSISIDPTTGTVNIVGTTLNFNGVPLA